MSTLWIKVTPTDMKETVSSQAAGHISGHSVVRAKHTTRAHQKVSYIDHGKQLNPSRMKPGLYVAKTSLSLHPVLCQKDDPVGGPIAWIKRGDIVIYFGRVSMYDSAWVVVMTNNCEIGECVRGDLEEVTP